MLGRVSLVAATASAVLALGAMPASAATKHPWKVANLSGVVASGYWSKAHGKVTARVCVKNTGSAQVVVAFLAFEGRRDLGVTPDVRSVWNELGRGKTVCKTLKSTRTQHFTLELAKGTKTRPTGVGNPVAIY